VTKTTTRELQKLVVILGMQQIKGESRWAECGISGRHGGVERKKVGEILIWGGWG
jgi:hypothetical protein